jgi:hypothetical protein
MSLCTNMRYRLPCHSRKKIGTKIRYGMAPMVPIKKSIIPKDTKMFSIRSRTVENQVPWYLGTGTVFFLLLGLSAILPPAPEKVDPAVYSDKNAR